MQKNTRLESSRRTVPPKRRLRLRQLLGKRRQDSHCTQGPLKSGKQTALPTFQQPPLLECYKSHQTSFCCTWSLYPPTRWSVARERSRNNTVSSSCGSAKPVVNFTERRMRFM